MRGSVGGVSSPPPSSSSSSPHATSTFKILLSTDNHLGYLERDPIRGDDSFTSFEEVLRIGCFQHDVDAMLLGGDLFHENKPSLGCLVRVSSLLRKYVFGNKTITMELLSDPAVNFPTHALPLANFQDPNLNIALPIFAIHGNHDDPVGGTSALDVLATNACINYFGHTASLEDIHIQPILLRKGRTYLALYGLGHVRDERLLRCFQLKKVRFEAPPPIPMDPNDTDVGGAEPTWFRLLVVHQNRSTRPIPGGREVLTGGTTGPHPSSHSHHNKLEEYLAGFGMDLVIWGNEHMQQMAPQTSHGYDIIQPGSTIRTALQAQYVSPPKQCGVLEIRGSMYRLTPVTLQSVRPFVSRVVEMAQSFPRCRTVEAVENALRGVVQEMILEAEQEQVPLIPDDILQFHGALKFPLLALAVDFTDPSSTTFPQPNYFRLGQEYMGIVANPRDMIRPLKRLGGAGGVGWMEYGDHVQLAQQGRRRGRDGANGPDEEEEYIPILRTLQTDDIRTKIAEIFNAQAKDACGLLSEVEVSAAVHAYVEKEETSAIDERIVELLTSAQKSAFRRLTKHHQGRHKSSKSKKKNQSDEMTSTGGETEHDEGEDEGEESLSYLLTKYGEDAVLSPEAIAAAVARHKREVNRRYAESVQQQAEQAERLERRREALLLEDEEEGDRQRGQVSHAGQKGEAAKTAAGTTIRKAGAVLDELFDPQNMVRVATSTVEDALPLQDPLISRSNSAYPQGPSPGQNNPPAVSMTTSGERTRRRGSTATVETVVKREVLEGADENEEDPHRNAYGVNATGEPLNTTTTTTKKEREDHHDKEDSSDASSDSLDELLFASRRMVPAESAVEHALLQAQQFESGLLRRPGELGDAALGVGVAVGSSGPVGPVSGGKRTRATAAPTAAGRSTRAGRGKATTTTALRKGGGGDVVVVFDSDEDNHTDGVPPSASVTSASKRRRVATGEPATSTTAGTSQIRSGRGGGGRGRGTSHGTTRVKKETGVAAGAAMAGGSFMEGVGLPLYRPGEIAPSSSAGGSGPSNNDAVNFLSAWASQK